SFAHTDALAGDLAFVAQSGALTTALLDWAHLRRIGFSHFISLGNSLDVDFGDLLDYLGEDPHTRAILLYVEAVTSARKFMSAARAAARNKPVLAVKAGRVHEGARAATSHTGALAGSDDVYDAAFRRAGMLRVRTTRELFDAVETLARMKPLAGERLAIVSNGGGPAVMATDALMEGGGTLAALGPATLQRLDQALPANWSHGNPIDIVGDAPRERYVAALEAALADPGVDAVLLIHAPTAIVAATRIARACEPLLSGTRQPILTCWMGGESVRRAQAICAAAGAPTYTTPEEAVGGFLQVVQFDRNQRQLLEAPASIPESFQPKPELARSLLASVLAQGRTQLAEHEAKQLLAAYGIPVVDTRVARDLMELRRIADELGYPVALKILSPDLVHKSDVGGVALDIATAAELETAAEGMLARCRHERPAARLQGFTVQPMIRRDHAVELIAGIVVDATFGPIVLFGQGGVAVEVLRDRAVALPPLNLTLARELISRTRVHRLLMGFRNRPPVDSQALALALVQVAQLAVDCAEIAELDINPLLAYEHGVLALDARVTLKPTSLRSVERLAIRPYPKELEEYLEFEGRRVLLRPIRPEDQPQHSAFLARVSPEDLRTRFFRAIRAVSGRDLASLTQIDYERAMAFIAEVRDATTGANETLGVARAHADPDNIEAEFAILVRSDLKARGLGSALLSKLVHYCEERGIQRIVGEVLADNSRMLHLAKHCGFMLEPPANGIVRVTYDCNRTHTPKAV
ncbi:MAG TPA: bifunctional acetate--CoA ligase family protein/GNAT family N-acetyltransferase, partial [Steroidobacteraceae bacterium]|nr:bifunctional acetate--CoA ligase family protein/GNAT family N-acetyltransferase [Steroidobacteraceae bacterium]